MDETVPKLSRGKETTSWVIGVALVVLICLGAGYAFWSTRRTLETLRSVDHTRQVRLELERVLIAVVNVETGVRGFLMAGQRELLDEIGPNEQTARGSLESLQRLLRDNPEQRERLQRLAPLVEEKNALMREMLRVHREQGPEAGIALFRTLKGERLIHEIRTLIGQMEETEDRLLEVRSQAAQSASNTTLAVVAVGSAVVMLLMGLAVWTVRRELAARQHAALVQADARAYAESIVDTVREPLLVLNQELRVERANRSFYEYFRATPAETEQRLLSELGDGRWNLPRLTNLLQEALTLDKPFDDLEWEHELPGAGRRTMLLSGCKLYRPGNHAGAVLLALEDITERQRAARSSREVQAANQQLRALNAELEAFSYSVSHDLRAPLRHIDGFADMLANHAGEKLDDQGRRYLQTIADSARRMGTLIDDLLLFSRMGRAEMHRTKVDLDALTQDVIRELAGETGGRKVVWKRQELPVVEGDPALLRQVFVNLLGNALKYSRPRDPAVIEIHCTDAPGEKIICVRDNGVGFDMAYAHKLFGVFQRLHRSDEFEGTGIGLANVRRMITRHGGRTWAEAELDKGATIYFSLPAGTLPSASTHPPTPENS